MSGKDDDGDRVHLLGHLCAKHTAPVPALRTDAQGRPIRLGTMSQAPDGKATLGGELCYPRGDGTYTPVKAHGGPAQVASPAYRDSYERTFGLGKQTVGQA